MYLVLQFWFCLLNNHTVWCVPYEQTDIKYLDVLLKYKNHMTPVITAGPIIFYVNPTVRFYKIQHQSRLQRSSMFVRIPQRAHPPTDGTFSSVVTMCKQWKRNLLLRHKNIQTSMACSPGFTQLSLWVTSCWATAAEINSSGERHTQKTPNPLFTCMICVLGVSHCMTLITHTQQSGFWLHTLVKAVHRSRSGPNYSPCWSDNWSENTEQIVEDLLGIRSGSIGSVLRASHLAHYYIQYVNSLCSWGTELPGILHLDQDNNFSCFHI